MYIGGWFFLFHWIEIELGTIDRLAAWPISVSSYMDNFTSEGNVFFFIFWEFRFRGFFSDDKDRKLSVFQQTEMSFTLLIMHRVDCGGSVVLDNFRLFIKRGKISGNAQNWCQTFWIFVRFWWKKTLSGETFNVTSFPRFLVFVILSLNNARFCLWFHLIKSIKF